MKQSEKIPVNRVRALDLASQLQQEYSKQAWRDAEQRAWLRWLAEGGQVQRVTPNIRAVRRGGYYA